MTSGLTWVSLRCSLALAAVERFIESSSLNLEGERLASLLGDDCCEPAHVQSSEKSHNRRALRLTLQAGAQADPAGAID